MLRSFFITIRPENFRTGVSPRSEAAWQRGWTIHPDHALNLRLSGPLVFMCLLK